MAEIVQFYEKFMPGAIDGTSALKGKRKDYIRIEFPGDRNTVIDRAVKAEDMVKYAKSWEAYHNQEDQMAAAGGIPINAWPAIDEATVKMLKSNKVYTVEALVELTDTALQTLGPGMREVQKQAKIFLDNTSEENMALKSDITRLEGELAEMKAMIEEITAPTIIPESPRAEEKPDLDIPEFPEEANESDTERQNSI